MKRTASALDRSDPRHGESSFRNSSFSNINFGPGAKTHFGDHIENHVYGDTSKRRSSLHQRKLAVLSSLEFPEMNARFAAVDDNCDGTFEWVFKGRDMEDHESGIQSTESLPCWLTRKSGGFLISGKPGSGKSTLMKYLAEHAETKLMLQSWAKQYKRSLAVVSFFFWGLGSELQQSQEGLWRSILHQILKRDHSLLSDVLSRRCTDNYVSMEYLEAQPWSRNELSAALRDLVKATVDRNFCLCIFIDGLDEYTGQEGHLIDDIKGLLSTPFIKICASSRPRPLYQACFPQPLVLHEHTWYDISRLIDTTLCQDEKFLQLKEPPKAKQALLHTIGFKAKGVFLWVVLTIRELKKDLVHHASLEELKDTLSILPDELGGPQGLFAKIIARTRSQDQIYMARLMILLQHGDLVLYEIYFICDDVRDPHFAVKECLGLPERYRGPLYKPWDHSADDPPEDDGVLCCYRHVFETCFPRFHPRDSSCYVDFMDLERDTKARVLKWCSDLVEVRHGRNGLRVSLMHKTLADYLALPEARQHLIELAGVSFDPIVTRLRLLLAASRMTPYVPDMSYAVCKFLKQAGAVVRSRKVEVEHIVESFEQVQTLDWCNGALSFPTGDDIPVFCWAQRCLHDRFRPPWRLLDSIGLSDNELNHAWFLALCGRVDVCCFIRCSWEILATDRRQGVGTIILAGLLSTRGMMGEDEFNLVRWMFECGVNPNVKYRWIEMETDRTETPMQLTLWEVFIRAVTVPWTKHGAEELEWALVAVEIFLDSGHADRNCSLPEGSKSIIGAMTGIPCYSSAWWNETDAHSSMNDDDVEALLDCGPPQEINVLFDLDKWIASLSSRGLPVDEDCNAVSEANRGRLDRDRRSVPSQKPLGDD